MLENKNIKFKKYDNSRKTIQRQIKLRKEIAEDLNKTIAIFKEDSYGLNMNNSILINLILEDYFIYLDTLGEDQAIELLKSRVISHNGANE